MKEVFTSVLRVFGMSVIVGGALFTTASDALATSYSQLRICNYGHNGDLYFAHGSRRLGSDFPFSGVGWARAAPGTCMLAGNYDGEKQVAFAFAVKNSSGDLIPVMTRPSTDVVANADLGALCAVRREGNFGSARNARDGCPKDQMPVPISFALITEKRFSGQDVAFNVGVYPRDEAFDLAALPPAHVAPSSAPQFDPSVEVSPIVCNRSSGRVQVTARPVTGSTRSEKEALGSGSCMYLRYVPEGTEYEFLIEEEGNFGKYSEVSVSQDGTFYANQYKEIGELGDSGFPASFSVVMIKRSAQNFTVYIDGSHGRPRVIGAEF